MAAAKMTLRLRKKSALDKSSEVLSAEASPDSKCPICLDRFNNMAYLDLCLHKFCFRCIHEWSKNKAECPLCKQPFNSIYHSIQSEKDFKKYDLRPTENGSFGSFAGERFRYRTTLTGARRQDQRRTSPPPDNGVMFEALTGASPPPRQDRGLRRMMARLAARRRAESEGRTVRSLREQEMIDHKIIQKMEVNSGKKECSILSQAHLFSRKQHLIISPFQQNKSFCCDDKKS